MLLQTHQSSSSEAPALFKVAQGSEAFLCSQEKKQKKFIQIKSQRDSCASLKHVTMLRTLFKIIVETDCGVIKPKRAPSE